MRKPRESRSGSGENRVEMFPGTQVARSRDVAYSLAKESASAAAQVPYSPLTVAADGHSPRSSRRNACAPRRRAWVRDQSYDDGARP